MPFSKEVVLLAKSYKDGRWCVAGKVLRDSEPDGWIRPVGASDLKGVTNRDIQYESGETPDMLDIIEISFLESVPNKFQTENCRIDGGEYWEKTGKFPASKLDSLCDSPASLWINGYSSSRGLSDKIPEDRAVKNLSNSLFFIRPDHLVLVRVNYMRRKRVRACFYFNGETYNLGVTDPLICAKYDEYDEGEYSIKQDVYLCISLAQAFERDGFCYKLVASIINPD